MALPFEPLGLAKLLNATVAVVKMSNFTVGNRIAKRECYKLEKFRKILLKSQRKK